MKDNYGREINYLRVSITDLCNLRCRYCMPEEGIFKKTHDDMLSDDEFITAVRAAAFLGITKIRITGGEPLVKHDCISLCKNIASIPGIKELCVTTNATLLKDNAVALKNAGVNRLNISLDTLDRDKYAYITRRDKYDEAIDGIKTALNIGFDKIKINTVLIGGFNDNEIKVLTDLTKQYPVDVRFIELMPMLGNDDFKNDAFIPCSRVLDEIADYEEQPNDYGVARLYRLNGAKGNIGLISPLTNHFCNTCNRLRLMADGKIKPCLHSKIEYSVKGKTFEEMVEEFKRAIIAKPAQHAELSYTNRSEAGRSMNSIGG